MTDRPLGRRVPTDWQHVERHPFAAAATPDLVEHTLQMPRWAHEFYDQGAEGACVGFGSSQAMSVLHRHRLDARWLWDRAKEVDEWPDTNPGDDNGTSVRAAFDVLRTRGHVRMVSGHDTPPALIEGVAGNTWATSVDDVRAAVKHGEPVVLGVNWYTAFDHPQLVKGEQWVGTGQLGTIRGGHCICTIAASDRRQAVAFTNSWGASYPRKVWLPYTVLTRLLHEDGEAAVPR